MTRPYNFAKIHNDDSVFEHDNERKIGHIHINGKKDADHHLYLKNDKNLRNLDLILIVETKLTKQTNNSELAKKLCQFNLLQIFDADDDKNHIGM